MSTDKNDSRYTESLEWSGFCGFCECQTRQGRETMKYASFGSISHGTVREEDLIPTFASEVEYQVKRNAEAWCSDEEGRMQRDRLLSLAHEATDSLEVDEDTEEYVDGEAAGDVLARLVDALGEFAPPYAYFGAHEGDGSDYGFWLSSEFGEEFDGLKVSDLADVPDDYEGEAAVVNDHGNVTLYACDKGETREVWSLV